MSVQWFVFGSRLTLALTMAWLRSCRLLSIAKVTWSCANLVIRSSDLAWACWTCASVEIESASSRREESILSRWDWSFELSHVWFDVEEGDCSIAGDIEHQVQVLTCNMRNCYTSKALSIKATEAWRTGKRRFRKSRSVPFVWLVPLVRRLAESKAHIDMNVGSISLHCKRRSNLQL